MPEQRGKIRSQTIGAFKIVQIKSFNLPKYNEIFNPEFENDDDYLDDDDEEGDENERLTLAARVERRILKRKAAENWRNNRERLLYEYSQFTYTSTPVRSRKAILRSRKINVNI